MSTEVIKENFLQLSEDETAQNEPENSGAAEVESKVSATEVVTKDTGSTKNAPLKSKKREKRGFSLEKRRAVAGWLFVSPFLIGFVVFMLYPLITSFIWSIADPLSHVTVDPVTNKGYFEILAFVGLGNYGNILSSDYEFIKSFIETIERTFLWTPFIIVFSLFIAIMLNRKIRFRGVFRVIYFLPVLLGTGLVFSKLSPVTEMLVVPQGLTNSIQYIFGSESIGSFLQDLLANIINMFWKMGVQIVIFLAGLQGISDSYYEAAKVDSANWWDMLWKITIPMVSPMILLNTVYTIIDSFRDNTNPIVEYIVSRYEQGNQWALFSTMGWIFFALTSIMLGIVFLASRRFIFYEK